MASTLPAPAPLVQHPDCDDGGAKLANLGFLTVLQEANGYLGGYLVTNTWGRPLEFRLSSAVQPNKVQQILYAGTLQPYVCADLIGKTLVDKAAVPVQLIVTDHEVVLDLRLKSDAVVLWLGTGEEAKDRTATVVGPAPNERGVLFCHPRFPQDVTTARNLLARLDTTFDLAEPFNRIREAIAEARKMGVGNR